ncbi:MAG TPA: hypothetical protein VFV58_28120 [Blastocatellia bacterium]|jgi:hypothetical protein|nr:hypothetical protein [Blastocatellia bacterium]
MKSKPVIISRTLKALAIMAFCFNFGVITPTAPMLGAAARAQDAKTQKFQSILAKANAKQALQQTNATKYDTAIRNISALEQAPLKTEADVKRVMDTLQKNEIDDGMVFGKGFTMAINNSSFKAGVEAEANRLSPNGVATQIKSKSLSISRIGGFNDLKTALKRQFDGDAATLKRVGARLQQAAKQRGISLSSPGSAPKTGMATAFASGFLGKKSLSNSFISKNNYCSTPADTPARTSAPTVEPAQIDPVTGSILAGVALGAAAYLITKYAEHKVIHDLEDDPDTGVSPTAACRTDAKNARNRCLAKHDGDFFAQAGCWAQYTVDEAACLLLPL